MPEMTISENAVRSLASIKPKPSANIKIGQNPFSSGAPDKAMYTTPKRNTKNGSNAPKIPP